MSSEVSPPDSLQVYHALSKYFAATSHDHQKWWEDSAPTVARMLAYAKYDLCEQFQYLYLLGTHIIPLLGPFPTPGSLRYMSVMGAKPLESSMNFTASRATVRIGLEPTNHFASTGKDPCNRLMADVALSRLKILNPGTDLQLYHRLIDNLTLTDEEVQTIADRNELDNFPCKGQVSLALDLRGGDMVVKVYMYSILKSAFTGTPALKLISDSVRMVDDQGIFSEPLDMVETFFNAAPPSLNVHFLGCDLVNRNTTRFKIYFTEREATFARISDIWTLGGALQGDEAQTGLAMLKQLWETLQIPQGTRPPPEKAIMPGDPPNLQPFLFNVEIKPHNPRPKIQIYFPLSGINDKAIADALSIVFRKWGWTEYSDTYADNLASYKPEQNLIESTGLQSWMTFSYSDKTGPYTSLYYSH